MATPFNFHANVADAAARQRTDGLRRQLRFTEAHNDGLPPGTGAAVLTEAQRADFNGDDVKFCGKLDPNF